MQQDTQTGTRTPRTDPDSPHRLIASNRVEGTPVYNRAGEKLGRIESIMIDKISGHAEYAILSFGGLFGFGDSQHPLPWATLEYDPDKGGYVVDLDKQKLQSGPSFRAGEEPAFDRNYGRTVYDYYGIIYTR